VRMNLWLVGGQAGFLLENQSSASFGLPPNGGTANRLRPQIMTLAHVPPPPPLPISTPFLSLRSTDRFRQCLSLRTRTPHRLSQDLWISLHRLFNIRFRVRQVNESGCHVPMQTTPTYTRPAPHPWKSTLNDPVAS